jgi:hypothetical protein
VVYPVCLENKCPFTRTVGSNPTSSAQLKMADFLSVIFNCCCKMRDSNGSAGRFRGIFHFRKSNPTSSAQLKMADFLSVIFNCCCKMRDSNGSAGRFRGIFHFRKSNPILFAERNFALFGVYFIGYRSHLGRREDGEMSDNK